MSTIAFPRRAAASKLPPPPRHLERPERDLWRSIVQQRDFSQDGPRAALATALDAKARARRIREQINREGETVTDRFGHQKPHPLLTAEITAMAAFHRAMKLLGILDT